MPALRAQSLRELVRAARKPGDVGAAVDRVDVVGEGEDVLGVRVVVLEGDLDDGVAFLALDVDRALGQDILVPVHVPDEGHQAAFEVERALAVVALVDERDPDALVEVGGLAQALGDRLERVVGLLEHLGIGPEAGPGALARAGRSDLDHLRGGLAAGVFLGPDEAVAGRFDAHPLGERVDDADTDAVQAARDLVAALLELRAGVEDRVDHLERVDSALVPADRHAATVVLDGDHAVGGDLDRDPCREAGHRLVDRVVDDLPDEVVQAPGVGRADVHAGALPDGLEALEDLDALGVVVGAALAGGLGPWTAFGRGTCGCARARSWRPLRTWRRSPSDWSRRSRGSSGQAVIEAPEILVGVVLDHDSSALSASGHGYLRSQGVSEVVFDALEVRVGPGRVRCARRPGLAEAAGELLGLPNRQAAVDDRQYGRSCRRSSTAACRFGRPRSPPPAPAAERTEHAQVRPGPRAASKTTSETLWERRYPWREAERRTNRNSIHRRGSGAPL